MKDGQELLAEYLRTGSEAAFSQVVHRYVNFVYSVAFRLVGGDTLLAGDVAQTVFIDLARNAKGFSNAVRLGGWLHEHTFHVATKAARSEKRRQVREQEAVRMSTLQENNCLAQSGPVLHEAIRKLSEEDRAAILLRFFEQRDFRAVGQVLGSTEDAARMRVNRALEKLHGLLNKQGIALSVSGLAAVLATEAVTAAPAGLASTIAGTALVGVGTTGTALTALKLVSVTKLKFVMVTALSVLAVAAPLTVIVQHQSLSRLREENRILQAQRGSLAQLAAENERLSNLVAAVSRGPTADQDQVRELLRLRGEIALLRQKSKDLEQLQKENGELRTRQAAMPPPRQDQLSTDDAARDCINQLKQIDGAIQQCALEHSLSESDNVTVEQIMPYLKNRTDAVFRCPSGGTYTFGSVTNFPLCTVSGHAIPADSVKHFLLPRDPAVGK